jgi:hypothetical protein
MRIKHRLLGLLGVSLAVTAWIISSACNAQALAPDEEGFRPLFTSKGMAAWGWNKKGPKIENGEMLLGQGSGDIWTTEEFGDFILDLEFKTSPGSNSGVFIRNPKPGDWYGGIEIQVLDSFGNQNPGKHDVASVYDVLAPSKNTVKAPGEWNRMTITCKGPSLKVALNNEQVIDMNLDLWTEAGKNPDGSANKFKTAYKDMPRKGVIELQDHGQDITFRNVRIKELKD